MVSRRPLTIFCRIIGAACVVVGALVLAAQIAEWWRFGDWNTVSVRYVLGYFNIPGTLAFSSEYGSLDFPVSLLFLGAAPLIALLGGKLPRRNTKVPHDNLQ